MEKASTFRVILFAASFVLASSGAADALTLSTPLVPANSGELVDCIITNLSTKTVEFSVQLLSYTGTVVAPNLSTCGSAIAPMGTCQVLPTVNTPVVCVFTAKSGKVKAAAYVFDAGNGNKLSGVVPATK